MPLLKGRFVTPRKSSTDTIDPEAKFVIPHTKEQFKTKEEYEKRLSLYNDEIWTCQCTGAIKLTHEEACKSEQKVHDMLDQDFGKYYEKTVLEVVHHSTEILDNLTYKAWTKLHQAMCEGEPVQLKLKADGQGIEATIVKIDSEENAGNTSNCSSPSSNKENKDEENKQKAADADSPSKKAGPPKLLPHKYTIKLTTGDVEKVISGVPADEISRTQRPPSKELIKLFIRAKAVRGGYQFNSPWIVEEGLVKKYSIPGKYADFLVSTAKMVELGRKALDDATKNAKTLNKRKSLSNSAKKNKTDKGPVDKNQPKLKLGRGPGRPKGSTNSPKKAVTPKKSPKKSAKSPAKVIQLSSSSSSDSSSSESSSSSSESDSSSDSGSDSDGETAKQDEEDRREKPSEESSSNNESKEEFNVKDEVKTEEKPKKKKKPKDKSDDKPKKKRKTKDKDEKKPRGRPRIHPPKLKVLNADGSPRKRGRPKKSDSFILSDGTPYTPSPNKPKKMKQMTLLDMKGKGKGTTPKGAKSSPKKTPSQKSPKKPPAPYKLPPIAAKLKKAMEKGVKATISLLTGQCARELSLVNIKKLPENLKTPVMKKYEAIREKKRIEKMTPEEKEEYYKNKKEEMKKKLREAMKKRWHEQNKRYEDSNLDLKPIPTPKIVPTPDGIPNELFGEIAMITEFISCYKELFMPEDQTYISTDLLMKAIVEGKTSYAYLAKVIGILLQTLLQDEIAEDYKELTIPLSEIAVNPSTVSELIRLCLRKRDSEADTGSEDSNEDEQEEDEVPEEIVEQLETSELYELTIDSKLKILTGLCHRIMGSYTVQDYLETKQAEASELWRKRIASQKEKNDLIKEEKQKKKSAKKTAPKETKKEDKKGVTLESFYGGQNADSSQDEDLVSTIKRRRMLAAKAAEEKRAKDKEERVRREKEAEEQRKVKEFEVVEKQFQEGTAAARYALRQSPLGTDRNHNRYWLFHLSTPGLFVEKGWVNEEVDYCTRPEDMSSSSSDESGSEGEGDEPKRGRKKRPEKKNVEKTVPHTGQNLWFMYDDMDDVNTLIESLHPLGVRESALKKELTQNLELITKGIKHKQKTAEEEEKIPDMDPLETYKTEVIDLECRLRNGGLGGVPDFSLWEKSVHGASTINDLGEMMIESQKNVLDKFLKDMMAKKIRKPIVKEEKEETDEPDTKDEVKSEPDEEREEQEGVDYTEVCPGLESWNEAIRSCPTWSRLHVLMGIMESCVKWEKSAENAKCKICRKKGDEDRLLLCDECNQPFHLYCLRPSLFEVPTTEWFCPACVPQSKRRTSRKTNYRELADYSDEEESESDENEDEEANEDNCVVCGGDEGLVGCSACPSSFHLDCHEPPLRTAPRSSTWKCMQCKSGRRIGEKSRGTTTKKRKRYVESEDSDSDYDEKPAKRSRASDTRSSRSYGRAREQTTSNGNRGTRRSRGNAEAYNESDLWGPKPTVQTSTRGKFVNGEVSEGSKKTDEKKAILAIIKKMRSNASSWPFLEPVDVADVPDYYDIIKHPIDLATIESKCISEQYNDVKDFAADIALMFDNGDLYNSRESLVGKCIPKLEKVFMGQLWKQFPYCKYKRAPQQEEEEDDDEEDEGEEEDEDEDEEEEEEEGEEEEEEDDDEEDGEVMMDHSGMNGEDLPADHRYSVY